ncbi:hypothetical protein SAMN02910358_02072 [Lachnospiraceae bacterium XBB1006]|nr:hypothetical protein SAMN02910358_02072 [Lachnospiraceae bacterium XBB1006]
MKKKLFLAIMTAALLFAACGKKTADKKATEPEENKTQVETNDKTEAESEATDEPEAKENEEDDTEETIAKFLADIQSSASTIQQEITKVSEYAKEFEAYHDKDVSQTELNELSRYPVVIWETEMNSLWKRYAKNASDDEKNSQKTWESLKTGIIETQLKAYKDGSIYGLMTNDTNALFNKHRAYYIASLIADANKETFALPERDVYGSYATEDGKSMLMIQPGMESGYEATLVLDGKEPITGSIEESGDDYYFTGNDGKTKGTVTLKWFGAMFTSDDSETHEFSVVF